MSTTMIQPEWVPLDINDLGRSVFDETPSNDDKIELKKLSLLRALSVGDYSILKNLTLTRNGLIDLDLRFKIWPVLLYGGGEDKDVEYKLLPAHRDEYQLQLDIDRSFNSIRDNTDYKIQLSTMITKFLRSHPQLSYYQGLHDIGSIIVIVFNKDLQKGYTFFEKMALYHLRDFMLPDIEYSIDHLKLIPKLMSHLDKQLYNLIRELPPFYSLSSIITLFSHNLNCVDKLCLIWDLIICENSIVVSIYVYVTAMIYYKDSILDQLQDYNKDIIHSILSNFFNDQNIDEILLLTQLNLIKVPPSMILNDIPRNSVLKTTSLYTPNLTIEQLHQRYEIDTSILLQKQLLKPQDWSPLHFIKYSILIGLISILLYTVDKKFIYKLH